MLNRPTFGGHITNQPAAAVAGYRQPAGLPFCQPAVPIGCFQVHTVVNVTF